MDHVGRGSVENVCLRGEVFVLFGSSGFVIVIVV